jgi:hypothetical protein
MDNALRSSVAICEFYSQLFGDFPTFSRAEFGISVEVEKGQQASRNRQALARQIGRAKEPAGREDHAGHHGGSELWSGIGFRAGSASRTTRLGGEGL